MEEEKRKQENPKCWKGSTSPPPTGRPVSTLFPSTRWLTSLNPSLFPFIAEHGVIWDGVSL